MCLLLATVLLPFVQVILGTGNPEALHSRIAVWPNSLLSALESHPGCTVASCERIMQNVEKVYNR